MGGLALPAQLDTHNILQHLPKLCKLVVIKKMWTLYLSSRHTCTSFSLSLFISFPPPSPLPSLLCLYSPCPFSLVPPFSSSLLPVPSLSTLPYPPLPSLQLTSHAVRYTVCTSGRLTDGMCTWSKWNGLMAHCTPYEELMEIFSPSKQR